MTAETGLPDNTGQPRTPTNAVPSVLPYTFTDPDGDTLTVEKDGDGALITISQDGEECSVLVAAFQLAEAAEGILAALYEAAGVEVPKRLRPVDGAEDSWEPLDAEAARSAVVTGGPADG